MARYYARLALVALILALLALILTIWAPPFRVV